MVGVSWCFLIDFLNASFHSLILPFHYSQLFMSPCWSWAVVRVVAYAECS